MKKILVPVLILLAVCFASFGQAVRIDNRIDPWGWEDLRFPANGIDPAGSAAPPSRDNTDGLLSFSGSADNIIAIQVQLPHGWDAGTSLSPHFHAINTAASAGTTTWLLEWKAANIGEDFPAVWASSSVAAYFPAATSTHIMPVFPAIDMTGKTFSCMMVMKLTRQGNSDSYNNAVKLLEFDIHYRHNKFGAGSF